MMDMGSFLKKHIANLLTLARLVAVLPLLLLLYSHLEDRFFYALILFCAIIPTDTLDGYLARKLGQTSELGRFLDPLCDKTLVYALLFSLFKFEIYTPYTIFPMFFRDILVDGLRNYMVKIGRVLPANFSGKTKFTLQTVSIIMGLLHLQINGQTPSWLATLSNLILGVAFLVSLLALPVFYSRIHSSVANKNSP
jgi:CDP-diacylglycerol--glycerol-3-phosphate 3-phosphatidyltransferase